MPGGFRSNGMILKHAIRKMEEETKLEIKVKSYHRYRRREISLRETVAVRIDNLILAGNVHNVSTTEHVNAHCKRLRFNKSSDNHIGNQHRCYNW